MMRAVSSFVFPASCPLAFPMRPARHGSSIDGVPAPGALRRRPVSGGARSLRDLSCPGRTPAGGGRLAPVRGRGVPGLPAVRMARGRVRPFSLRRLWPRPAGSLQLQRKGGVWELRWSPDGGTRRAPGGPCLPGRARAAVGADAVVSAALSPGVGPRPVSRRGPSTVLRAIPSQVEGWRASPSARFSSFCGTRRATREWTTAAAGR